MCLKKGGVLIEGPELSSDFSYYLVNECPALKELEIGIPEGQFIKMKFATSTPKEELVDEDSSSGGSIDNIS